uniref:Uncharacterized protein n=1 Tax=Caenorhabditis japonica TaxID=281687 RepID=A0A8R1IVH4_CAEJA
MMMLAQYGGDPPGTQRATLVDEQFYQQHAFQYQQSYQEYYQYPQAAKLASQKPAQASKEVNLLQQQLSFLKKKVDKKAKSPTPSAQTALVIPADRPNKPNKEKERGERYIPEPARRPWNRSNYRDDRSRGRNSRQFQDVSPPRRQRSRSLTWSPVDRKSESPARKSRKSEKRERKRSRTRSPSTDYEYRKSSKKYDRGDSKSSRKRN